MPELPEVEMMARLLSGALSGAVIEKVKSPGLGTLKSFDPPVESLIGAEIDGVRRRGKHLLVDASSSVTMLIHLMSAGRLQVFDKAASSKDRRSRFLIDLADGRQLRLREFGTHQSAWVKLVETKKVDFEESLATLGPEAWPGPIDLKGRLNHPRPLHTLLRDQRVIAGIGRSWIDEILHSARLSPFKRGSDLTAQEIAVLEEAIPKSLDRAISHYEKVLAIPLSDKLPMPLEVHNKRGEPCPRCQTKLEAVRFEDHDLVYCPQCQTGGKTLKDRRMSRLLK
ncbi:MAG: DNA-formamidopyrimidine glycosylase [Actinobacteria bacterium]|nr:DNA-formamidopyrimidine glycosylase [Actinomycetota bacterium]